MTVEAVRTPSEGDSPPGDYFFMSYAHSPVLSERSAPPGGAGDEAVRAFFDDLQGAVVERIGRPGAGPRIGFFDQQVPSGEDLKRWLSDALGRAQVFVPLYSPHYLQSRWSLAEREAFRQRLRSAAVRAPERRIVPVLWTPFFSPDPPQAELEEVHQTVPTAPAQYRQEGVRALMRPFRTLYETVVRSVADRIVTVVEEHSLEPSAAPGLDEVTPAELPGGRDPQPVRRPATNFLVAHLGPDLNAPSRRPAGRRAWWDVPEGRPTVARIVTTSLQQYNYRPEIIDVQSAAERVGEVATILLIDERVAGERPDLLQVLDDRDWVIPFLLTDRSDVRSSSAAEIVAGLPAPARSRAVIVNAMERLAGVTPASANQARRNFFGRVQVPPPEVSGPGRPPHLDRRLRGDGEPGATGV